MLKKIKRLLDRYEHSDEIITASDVMEELQEILDDEPYNKELTPKLQQAIDEFVLARREYDRYAGHTPDGSEDFITEVERIIGFEN